MTSKGAVYIAYGDESIAECQRAIQAFKDVHPDIPLTVITDSHVFGVNGLFVASLNENPVWLSRRLKVSLYNLSPYDLTLYMDADTYTYRPLSIYWRLLERGFDLVITPAHQQEDDCLWHVGEPEKQRTLDAIGFTPLQLQGGVFAFRRSPACETFFARWKMEWLKYEGQDQASLLRALYDCPLRIALLSKVFNGGVHLAHAHRVRA